MAGNSDSVKITAQLQYGEDKEIQVSASKFVRTVMEASRKESVDTISMEALTDALNLGSLVVAQYKICNDPNGTTYFRRRLPWSVDGFEIKGGELVVPDVINRDDIPDRIVENWKRMANAASKASENYDGDSYAEYVKNLKEELEQ